MKNKALLVLGALILIGSFAGAIQYSSIQNLESAALKADLQAGKNTNQKIVTPQLLQKVYITGGDGAGLFQDGETWQSSDAVNWQHLPYSGTVGSSATIQLPNITNHAAAYFQGKFWITGGIDYTLPTQPGVPSMGFNTMYNSLDGKNWTHVDTNTSLTGIQDAPWSGRFSHKLVVFNGKMYLIGGAVNAPAPLYSIVGKDIWSTSDGTNWIHVDSNPALPGIQDAPWPQRMEFSSLVFNNKLWIMGGVNLNSSFNYVDLNDIWYTTDGIQWIQANQSANWSPRTISASVVYGNNMWIFGGLQHSNYIWMNDSWYSNDGINWIQSSSQVVPPANFLRILNAFVLNNKINIISGENPIPPPSGPATDENIYTTTDGVSFTLLTHNPPWVNIGGGVGGWGRFNFSLVTTP
jgi:hypothetical protein